MHLPGRLRATSLGDLLGACHRASATGTLELAEDCGRTHRIFLSQGLIVAVLLDGPAPSLAEILRGDHAADDDVLRRSLLRALASHRLHGDVLVNDFRLSPSVLGNALRRQLLTRLAALDALSDARVSFRVAVRPPRTAIHDHPLHPSEFLQGRRRARVRAAARPVPIDPYVDPEPWQVLGLHPGADTDAIKRAYKRLARDFHPDLHPHASDDERRELETRFSEITEAYRTLVA